MYNAHTCQFFLIFDWRVLIFFPSYTLDLLFYIFVTLCTSDFLYFTPDFLNIHHFFTYYSQHTLNLLTFLFFMLVFESFQNQEICQNVVIKLFWFVFAGRFIYEQHIEFARFCNFETEIPNFCFYFVLTINFFLLLFTWLLFFYTPAFFLFPYFIMHFFKHFILYLHPCIKIFKNARNDFIFSV